MVRVLAVEGHGGLLVPFEYFRAGRDVPFTTGVAFSHQLFDALRSVGAEATVLGQHLEVGKASADGITVEHTGRVLYGRSGLDYHAETLRLAASLTVRALREKCDIVMTVGYPQAGLLLPLLLSGRSVIVTHHCVLWPRFGAPNRAQRASWQLDRLAYQHPRCHVLAVSDDVVEQVETLRDGKGPAIVRFFPLFRRAVFADIAPADPHARELRVGFIGRIERSKGVFDVLDAVSRLHDEGRAVRLECCGDGGARAELAALVEARGLSKIVTLHGWCEQPQLRSVLAGVHVVVVPTRKDFVEGFNMVVVEALLAKRPVITARTCPALEYVRGPATIEVGVESVSDLTDALRRLVTDRAALARASASAEKSAAFFLDARYSYRAAVAEVLDAIMAGRPARPVAPSAAELRATPAAASTARRATPTRRRRASRPNDRPR